MRLAGWGRYPQAESALAAPRGEAALAERIGAGGAVARGNGRAYGDSAIGRAATLSMRRFDRMLAFDAGRGVLTAEAGVLLADVIAAFLPRGWFPAVTPGTKFVTLGGMIAADVHGKNHHSEGGFAGCVEWLDLMGPDGTVRRCSRTENAGLFDWTLGGMGLTGVILRAAMRLRPVETGWIRQTTVPAPDLDTALEALAAHDGATYSVAWIDCLARGAGLGRALVMLGEHARRDELAGEARARPFETPARAARRVPLDAPAWMLNGLTVRAFNALYYHRGRRAAGTRLVDWDGYFYPLDAVLGWNRIYGRRGFVQFQCALPPDAARAGLAALLGETSRAGAGSFLAVLKRLGPGGGGVSFPMEGLTLALDFPVTARTLALMERLDAITLAHGGRFYLAKDARMRAETLHRADPRAGALARMRAGAGLAPAFASAQSDRLGL